MLCYFALQSQLPKGSVSLAVSASGSTVYMEPEPVVALNNAEAMLRAQEQEEEESILAELSLMVKQSTVSLQRMMKAVTALDIAAARANHASWMSGKRPQFISAAEASEVCSFNGIGFAVDTASINGERGGQQEGGWGEKVGC